MPNRATTRGAITIVLVMATIAAGCADGTDTGTTTTTSPATITTTAPPATTTTTLPPTTTTVPPPTTTTTVDPASLFPTWRIPNHDEQSAVAYLAYAPFDAADGVEKMIRAHERLDEIGQDIWEGWGSLGCDLGAKAAMGLDDGLALGVYFDTPAEAHDFAAAWLSYFGEPVVGVVDVVTTFCLDDL